MHCQNCAALLEFSPFSAVANCEHCGTITPLSSLEHGSDRIVWSETPTGTCCPRCGDGLVQATLAGNPAQACTQCRGVMLANAAFGALVRERRAGYRGMAFTPHPVDLEQLTDPVACPGCRRMMEVHPYYGPGNQIIDSCCRCGLVWIDSGELTAMERASGVR